MVSVLYRSNRAVLSRCPSFTHTQTLSPSPSLSNLTILFLCLAIDPLILSFGHSYASLVASPSYEQ